MKIRLPHRESQVLTEIHEMLLFARVELGATQLLVAKQASVSPVVYRSWESPPSTTRHRKPTGFHRQWVEAFIRRNVKPEYIID